MNNVAQYWENTIDFETYISLTEERISNPSTEEDIAKKPYYELGLQRMNRTLKTFKADEVQCKNLESKNFRGSILIISEAWCGDASTTVPALVEFFKGRNDVRIFLRDQDLTLIDAFQTHGTHSIPKVLILDEEKNVLTTWGPRTEYGMNLLKKFKENPEEYPRETFYNDLQVYYAKNRGKDVIEEIINLLP